MTAQIRDILVYNENKFQIAAEPLKDYLEDATLKHPLVSPNTACWRGYYSEWVVDNKKLFLTNWEGYILNYETVGMDFLFPGQEIVFAEWFSGPIRIGVGKMIEYIHSGYDSIFEGEMFLIFENGILVNEYTKWLSKEEIDTIMSQDDLPF